MDTDGEQERGQKGLPGYFGSSQVEEQPGGVFAPWPLYHYIQWEEQGSLVSAGDWKENPSQKWHLTPIMKWKQPHLQAERGRKEFRVFAGPKS